MLAVQTLPENNKIFIRLIIKLSSVVFLTALITGITTYYLFNNTLKEDAYHHNIDVLRQTKQIVEIVLSEIENIAFSLAINSDVQRVISLPWKTAFDYPVLRSINGILNDKINANRYIHSIFLYSKEVGKVIANSGIIDLNDFWDRKIIQDASNRAVKLGWTNPRTIAESSEEPPRVFSYLLNAPITDKPGKGLLVINVREELLYDALANITSTKLGNVAILDRQGNPLSYKYKSFLTRYLKEKWLIQRINSVDYGYFIERAPDLLISSVTSDYNGWKYIAINPIDDIFTKAMEVIKITLVVSGICMAIGIILLLLVSRRYYSPIANIVKTILNQVYVYNKNRRLNSVSDEFELIGATLEFLMDQNKRIGQLVQNNQLLLKEHFLHNLLLRRGMGLMEIRRLMSALNIDLGQKQVSVMILQAGSQEGLSSLPDHQVEILHSQIQIMAKDIINHLARGEVINLGPLKSILLLSHDKLPNHGEIALRLHDTIRDQLKIESRIGTGGPYGKITDISLAYREALLALDEGIHSGDSEAIDPFVSFQEEFEKILQPLKRGDVEGAQSLFHHHHHRILQEKYSIRRDYWLTGLINALLNQSVEADNDLTEILGRGYNPYYQLAKKISAEQIGESLCDLMAKVSFSAHTRYSRKNQELIHSIVAYIKENYHQPLYLTMIAERIYMNSNYFCRLFKEVTGKTFIEFLTEVRVEQAVRLLKETNETVADIALDAGFGSKRNIIRAFKKYKGITPALFRKTLARQAFAD